MPPSASATASADTVSGSNAARPSGIASTSSAPKAMSVSSASAGGAGGAGRCGTKGGYPPSDPGLALPISGVTSIGPFDWMVRPPGARLHAARLRLDRCDHLRKRLDRPVHGHVAIDFQLPPLEIRQHILAPRMTHPG